MLVSDAVLEALPGEHGYAFEDLGEAGLQGEPRLGAVDWAAA